MTYSCFGHDVTNKGDELAKKIYSTACWDGFIKSPHSKWGFGLFWNTAGADFKLQLGNFMFGSLVDGQYCSNREAPAGMCAVSKAFVLDLDPAAREAAALVGKSNPQNPLEVALSDDAFAAYMLSDKQVYARCSFDLMGVYASFYSKYCCNPVGTTKPNPKLLQKYANAVSGSRFSYDLTYQNSLCPNVIVHSFSPPRGTA